MLFIRLFEGFSWLVLTICLSFDAVILPALCLYHILDLDCFLVSRSTVSICFGVISGNLNVVQCCRRVSSGICKVVESLCSIIDLGKASVDDFGIKLV